MTKGHPDDPVVRAFLELLYSAQMLSGAFAKLDRELRASGRYSDELHRVLGQLRPAAAIPATSVDPGSDSPDDALMDTTQIAARLNVSPRTARRLTATGAIASVKVGGQRRVTPEALADYLETPDAC